MFVDNLGAICDNVALSQKMVFEWTEIFEPFGSALHKTGKHMGLGEALGTELDGRELSSRVTSKRVWMLRQGLRRRRRSGTFMGLHLGEHCARFTHLLPLHSVPLTQKNGQIWEEVIAELRFFRGHGGFPGTSVCSKETPVCTVGRWHKASGHVRPLRKLVEPWKGADSVEWVLTLHASQH